MTEIGKNLPMKSEKKSHKISKIHEPQATCLYPLEQGSVFHKKNLETFFFSDF